MKQIYKKLNQGGFSHDLIVVVIVVVIAIAGAGYLVASHAATCNTVSGATSGTTSGSTTVSGSGVNCPTSGSTSNPVSLVAYQAKCNIADIPKTIAGGEKFQPAIVVTNTGTKAIQPKVITAVNITSGGSTTLKEVSFNTVQPGRQGIKILPAYTTPATLTKTTLYGSVHTYSDLSYSGTKASFSCTSTTFSITE